MDDTQQEALYTKGYNAGYILSRYEPELLKQLTKEQTSESPYIKGMTAGQRTHAREVFMDGIQRSRTNGREIGKPRIH